MNLTPVRKMFLMSPQIFLKKPAMSPQILVMNCHIWVWYRTTIRASAIMASAISTSGFDSSCSFIAMSASVISPSAGTSSLFAAAHWAVRLTTFAPSSRNGVRVMTSWMIAGSSTFSSWMPTGPSWTSSSPSSLMRPTRVAPRIGPICAARTVIVFVNWVKNGDLTSAASGAAMAWSIDPPAFTRTPNRGIS